MNSKSTKIFLLSTILLIAHITNAQIITTIAGTGGAGYTGDWGPPTACEMNNPTELYFGGVGSYGSLFVGDVGNNVVREIKLGGGGIIYTIAGTGATGYAGDGGLATDAEINKPHGITIDNHNNIYFDDRYNNKVRMISGTPPSETSSVSNTSQCDLFPNPATSE